jgi:hypothetical protein
VTTPFGKQCVGIGVLRGGQVRRQDDKGSRKGVRVVGPRIRANDEPRFSHLHIAKRRQSLSHDSTHLVGDAQAIVGSEI